MKNNSTNTLISNQVINSGHIENVDKSAFPCTKMWQSKIDHLIITRPGALLLPCFLCTSVIKRDEVFT